MELRLLLGLLFDKKPHFPRFKHLEEDPELEFISLDELRGNSITLMGKDPAPGRSWRCWEEDLGPRGDRRGCGPVTNGFYKEQETLRCQRGKQQEFGEVFGGCSSSSGFFHGICPSLSLPRGVGVVSLHEGCGGNGAGRVTLVLGGTNGVGRVTLMLGVTPTSGR